jgi:hypothetical protein
MSDDNSSESILRFILSDDERTGRALRLLMPLATLVTVFLITIVLSIVNVPSMATAIGGIGLSILGTLAGRAHRRAKAAPGELDKN